MAKKKKSFKYLFDRYRKFIPLHWILSKEEMKDKILLGRVLAIYDTFHIRELGVEGIIELLLEKESGNYKIKKTKPSKLKQKEMSLKRKQQMEEIKNVGLGLTKTKIYRKLAKANWIPLVYCGDATFSMKIFTKRRR